MANPRTDAIRVNAIYSSSYYVAYFIGSLENRFVIYIIICTRVGDNYFEGYNLGIKRVSLMSLSANYKSTKLSRDEHGQLRSKDLIHWNEKWARNDLFRGYYIRDNSLRPSKNKQSLSLSDNRGTRSIAEWYSVQQ